MAPRRRGERLHPAVRSLIQKIAVEQPWLAAAQIHAVIEKAADDRGSGFSDSDVPNVRTVQNLVRPLRVADESDPWTLADADPSEIPAILPVLRHVALWSGGRRRHLTRKEVHLAVRVRAAAPDAEPRMVWGLVRGYMSALDDSEIEGDPEFTLEAAFGLWGESATDEDYREFDEALDGTLGRRIAQETRRRREERAARGSDRLDEIVRELKSRGYGDAE